MRMIELTRVISNRGRSPFADTDDIGENRSPTASATINVDAIRCFYLRRGGEPGCRITFVDGGGFAVTEDYASLQALVSSA